MTTVHHPAPQPGLTSFAIYEDPEDREPMSPSDVYEGDVSYNSEQSLPMADDALPSIELEQELDDELEPYRSSYTSRKSASQPRRSSHFSFVSAIPSESSVSSKPILPANEASARSRKERPRFRNPESVRAMQMSSPPPLPAYEAYEASRERMKPSYKLATPSRSGRSETPVSRRSGSQRRSIREQHSPRPTQTPQQAPLVLLHVTILPMQVPYSHDLMARIMPGWLVDNYKLLEEKLQDIILMRRGLLIPHPRDEYDLLEERILESLELRAPRLLKCGHFVPPEDDTDREEDDDAASLSDENTGRGSRMSGGTLTEGSKWEEHPSTARDHSMCIDCHRELKKPGKGVGAGSRKWDIKIYAANGLMRAAAWTASWNEMERCDVEISPWVPEEVHKTLERRVQEERESDKRKHMYTVELQRQIQEAAAKQRILEEEATEQKRAEEAELQKSFEAAAAALQKSIEDKAAEKKKFEEELEAKLEEAKVAVRLELEAQALAESNTIAERFRALESVLKQQEQVEDPSAASEDSHKPARPINAAQVPLSTLLKNYVLVLLGDQRNFIILLLSAVVVYLSMNMDPTWRQQLLWSESAVLPNEVVLIESIASVAVTATTTSTAFSTLTVTETQMAIAMQETSAARIEDVKPEVEALESSSFIVPVSKIGAQVIHEQLHENIAFLSELEEALPTSPAIEVAASSDTFEAGTELDVEVSQSIDAEQEIKTANQPPIAQTTEELDTCIPEPLFQAPTTICVAHGK